MKIEDMTDDQIKAELVRRKSAPAPIPQPLSDKQIKENLFDLKERAVKLIDDIAHDEEREDAKHFMYEAVMTAVYGTSVWNWINKTRK